MVVRDFNLRHKTIGEAALKFKGAPDSCKRCASWQGIPAPPFPYELAETTGGDISDLDAAINSVAGPGQDDGDGLDSGVGSAISQRREDDSSTQAASSKGE